MPEATNSAPRSDLATKKSLEDRIAILESELATQRGQRDSLGQIVTALATLFESLAAASKNTVVCTRALQIVDRRGNVTIQLTTGADNEPLVHLIHRNESGEIRHVDENVLFPPATHKGVNDD